MQEIHYRPRKVSEIKPTDGRVALMGRVVEVKEASFVLEDESGKAEVFSGEKPEVGKLVRVFCSAEGERLNADILQDLSKLDLDLFKKVSELYRRAGV
jgi:hypothetical protein